MARESGEKSVFELLSAFLLPIFIFLLILFKNRIVPFGETTLLYSDLDSQYIEFMAEYRRILTGDGSLLWSWHAGLGMNLPGLIAYYLASPFNFLLILFPENQLSLAITVLTALKLGCSGAAFAFFIQKHFKAKDTLAVLCAVCYALNAYMIGYAFNIMWLDALILLPLICTGIDRVIASEQHGISVLTILFSLSFLSQFYMAWMTGIFSVLYLLAGIINRKDSARNSLKAIICFGISAGIAAGISAFLLLPAFFVLKNNMGLIGQSIPMFAGKFPFFQIIQKLFMGSFDGIKDSLPHIYCGIPAVIGLVLYFTQKDIPAREKITSGSIAAILLFSFWFSPLDFFWHAMDHPSWFPYRYAFLFCFWILRLSFEGFHKNPYGRRLTSAFFSCAVLLLSASMMKVSGKVHFLLLNGIFLTGYFILTCFRRNKWQPCILLGVTCIELLLNGNLIISGYMNGYTRLSDYQSYHEHYRDLTEAVQPTEPDFYRMEKTTWRTYNDPLGIGFPGVSHFSSTANTRQSQYLKRLGFNCYATWCNYQGATAAADAMLRIRYEFAEGGKNGSVQTKEETWEHTALFPLFYFTEESYARYDFFNEADAIMRQNDLLRLLGSNDNENYFEPVPVNISHAENLQPDGPINYRKIRTDEPAWLEVKIEPAAEKSLYLFLPDASLSFTVTIDGTTEVMNGNRDYAPFPICLDPYTKDGSVKVRIETLKDSLTGGVQAYALDTALLDSLSRMINSTAPEVEKTSETSFILKTRPSDRGRLVVSSIPFDAGWRITSQGKRIPLKMIHESVLGFVLPSESDRIEIKYRPYGSEAGIILSCTALLCWLAAFVYEQRIKRNRRI